MAINSHGNMNFSCDLLVFKDDNDYWYNYNFSGRGKHVKQVWLML